MIKKYKDFVNESNERIVNGSYELHILNDEPILHFVEKYKGESVDIFFGFENDAQVSQRSSNLIFHGKNPKDLNLSKTKFVYCGLENEFYSCEDYRKLLRGVYHGTSVKIKAIPNYEIDKVLENE